MLGVHFILLSFSTDEVRFNFLIKSNIFLIVLSLSLSYIKESNKGFVLKSRQLDCLRIHHFHFSFFGICHFHFIVLESTIFDKRKENIRHIQKGIIGVIYLISILFFLIFCYGISTISRLLFGHTILGKEQLFPQIKRCKYYSSLIALSKMSCTLLRKRRKCWVACIKDIIGWDFGRQSEKVQNHNLTNYNCKMGLRSNSLHIILLGN